MGICSEGHSDNRYGGYVVNNGAWSYYLGVGDITNGYASDAGCDGNLPEMLYHGAKWSADSVCSVKGGLHNYAGNKYYMLKDGTILANGTMRVGDTWYEFGEDGACIRSYKKNYWKQERLGYYVRVGEDGNIIRTAGFYDIDGNTYFLCGNSGLTVSNEFTNEPAKVEYKSGKLLMIQSGDARVIPDEEE